MNSNNSIFNLGDKEEMSLEEFFDRIPEYDDDDDEIVGPPYFGSLKSGLKSIKMLPPNMRLNWLIYLKIRLCIFMILSDSPFIRSFRTLCEVV